MTLDEAKAMLDCCVRETLANHAFGDSEVYWSDGEEQVAAGYFGSDEREVSVGAQRFFGEDANVLRQCGKPGTYRRNDSQGDP